MKATVEIRIGEKNVIALITFERIEPLESMRRLYTYRYAVVGKDSSDGSVQFRKTGKVKCDYTAGMIGVLADLCHGISIAHPCIAGPYFKPLNKETCEHCGDTVFSLTRHDYVTCKCGATSVDGGSDYYRRSIKAPSVQPKHKTRKGNKNGK